MKYLIYLLFLSYGCHSKVVREITFDLGDYQFNAEIQNSFTNTKDGGFAATRFSFVSENQKALKALSINADTITKISEEKWNSIRSQFTFHDGLDYILSEAGKYDFLLVNEAHYIPQHRNFVRQLIPELSKLGYTNLALEAIGMMKNGEQYDKQIEERGYPTTRSGFYIKEPEFGNLIREAVNHGFSIIGYDEGSGADREIQGAKNILKVTQKSKGKTIVLCGWDHIKEAETGTYWGYALAGRIKEYTGNDVLTINQTAYYEREQHVYEDSIYQWVNVDYPAVLLDSMGESFDAEKNKDWYDIFIFHPRTKYINGFPDWFLKTIEIINYKIPNIEIDCPCKILVFEEKDDVSKAVPIYIIETIEISKMIKIPRLTSSNNKLVITNKNVSYLIE